MLCDITSKRKMKRHLKYRENITSRPESPYRKFPSIPFLIQLNINDDREELIDYLPIIYEYDALINESVQAFVAASQKIGGEIILASSRVLRAFNAQHRLLREAIRCNSFNEQQLLETMKPQSIEIEAMKALTYRSQESMLINHLLAVSEGIEALNWILVSPMPSQHVTDTSNTSTSYLKYIFEEYKEQDCIHREWAKLWINLLNDLYHYVRRYHPHGLAGTSKSEYTFRATFATVTEQNQTEAVPPSMFESNLIITNDNVRNPQANSTYAQSKNETKISENRDAEFNQSTIDTSSSQRNSMEYSTSLVPKFVLRDNKWFIQNQSNQPNLRITETDIQQNVHIYKCTNSNITIYGCVNSVILHQCTQIDLQFTTATSTVELIDCRNIKINFTGHVPIILIIRTSNCHIYMPKTSIDTEFLTLQATDSNIYILNDDNTYEQYRITEILKTSIQNRKLITFAKESVVA